MEVKSRLFFANKNLKKELEALKEGKLNEQELYNHLSRAFEDLKRNAFCGIQIPKRLIPKEYLSKFEIDNLWKYNLPGAWRLVYSVGKEGIEVISIVLEWMDHKTYERRFKY